jgi:hypothetical protein
MTIFIFKVLLVFPDGAKTILEKQRRATQRFNEKNRNKREILNAKNA